MEDTQAVNWDVEEEEYPERPNEPLGCSLEPVGRLRIFSSSHGPEKDFPLYLGKNVIGRKPECSVVLPFPSISKHHAVIEILSWNKAPILQDHGSLNGTQILRPPKILSPGTSHRLRDQEFILFGDIPCQYCRLSAPLSFVYRGPLTVEETPRVQGGTQSQRILLAEDSEEEVESPIERCVVKEPRTTTSPLATVVPESDEEGPSPAPGDPGPSIGFSLDSDTDEEENQPPAAGEISSTTTRGATAETELSKAEGVIAESQLVKDQCSVKDRDSDIKERDIKNVIPKRSTPAGEDSDTDVDAESTSTEKPDEVHFEMIQPSDFIDSDTDVEEERTPRISTVVSLREEETSHRANTSALLQESPAGNNTDMEKAMTPLIAAPERSQVPLPVDSNIDYEEVSAALAGLKENHAFTCERMSGGRVQPVVLGQCSLSTEGDSDTDVEEERHPTEERETVSKGHIAKTHSKKSQLPLEVRDIKEEEDASSPGVFLERSQASATTVISTHVVEDKHPIPRVIVSQTYVGAEGSPTKLPGVHLEDAWAPSANVCAQEGISSAPLAVACVRQTQLSLEGYSETKDATSILTTGTQNGSPVAQIEQDHHPVLRENLTNPVVDANTAREHIQSHREGTYNPTEGEREVHVDMNEDSGDNHDDSEDLKLQSTQCFVRENQSLEVQNMEDEPTQAFLLTLPQEPGPSQSNLQAQGFPDEPWEVLSTQPFCPREPETQPIEDHLEAHGPCSLSLTAASQVQHPDNPIQAEPLGTEGKRVQIVEKDTGHFNCKIPQAEGDQDCPDASLPPVVPEASASLQNPLISQNQNYVAPQPPPPSCPPPLEIPTPRTRQNVDEEAPEIPVSSDLESFHPKVRSRRSSRKTSSPVPSLALAPHLTAPIDQPVNSEPTSHTILGRTQSRSSVKTPEPGVLSPEPQLSTSRDQAVSRSTRGRTLRSSASTSELGVPSTLELQPSASTEQHVISKPILRGRTHRSPVNAPKPSVCIVTDLQSPNPIDQSVTPKSLSQVTRGRIHKSSVKTPEPVVPTSFELQSSSPTDQSVTSGVTRGRTYKPVKTPKPGNPTPRELQPSTSTEQPVVPEPTSRLTRGRTLRSSVKTPQYCELISPSLVSATPIDYPVASLATVQCDQSKTVKSSEVSVLVPITPEFQSPIPTEQSVFSELTPQANDSRKPKATRKQASLTVTISHETFSGPPKPKSRSLRSQKRENMREAKSSRTTPEPAFAQLPEITAQAPQIPKVELPSRSGSTPEPQSVASQSRKRSSSTVHSPPLQKQLQRREDPQKTGVSNEETEDTSESPAKEEGVVTLRPGKRKRNQTEEEPKALPGRSLRRTKPTRDSTAPKVLFTGVVDVRGEKAVLALGGSLASSVAEASHLVTDRIRRTVKFLCAVGRGIPILSLDWLHQSRKAGYFLPPDEYIVTDPEQEKNFGFSLREALRRAGEQRLLEGYEIHVTPGVQPPPPQMGEIISCCGGIVLPSMPRSYKPQRIVITCSQDYPRCSVPCRVGLPILSPEFLLTGVLKQEAKPESFILSTVEMSSV